MTLRPSSRPPLGEVRRSELSTPGHNLKMIAGASRSAADLVILDLEDACAPGQKVAARSTVIEALRTLPWTEKAVAVRINGLETAYALDDVLEVVGSAGEFLDVLIVPKVRSPEDVHYVDQLLTHVERKVGLEPGRIRLEILVETASGLAQVEAIAASSPRLVALIFGLYDLAGELGARTDGDTYLDFAYARQRLVVAARASRLLVLDGITAKYKDLELTRKEAERAQRLGFDGKWAIHPSQLEPINQAFTPTPEELAHAERVLRAYETAGRDEGRGAIVVGDEMVDRATLKVEERRLAVARKLGLHSR